MLWNTGASHVVAERSDALLLALSAISCPSQEPVWQVLSVAWALWHDVSIGR
jgi:hypothetical protein